MPSYKVLERGFDKHLYDPEGKRRVLHRDEPYPIIDGVEQVPSWLERISQDDTWMISKGNSFEEDPSFKEDPIPTSTVETL